MSARPMIFDTDGTGFYKKAIRQMMAQEEIPYLSGLGGSTGLGDEIMLLSGVDDVGAMYPHGFDDGPARTYTLPSPDRSNDYDFPSGSVEMGLNGMRLGQPLADLSAGWPKSTRHKSYHYTGLGKADYHYTGLGAGWPEQKNPSYRYTGLAAGWPAEQKKHSYRYTGLGLTSQAGAVALAAAQAARATCVAACSALGPGQPPCSAACEAAYAQASQAITSATCDVACIRAKLQQIIDATIPHTGHPAATSAPDPTTGGATSPDTSAPADDSGPSPVLVGGVLAAIVVGAIWWSNKKDREQYGR